MEISSLTTSATQTVETTLQNATLDVVLLISVFIFLVGYGMYAGRERLLSIIIALYPGIVLFETFPYFSKVPAAGGVSVESPGIQVGLFLLAVVGIALFIGSLITYPPVFGRVRSIISSGLLSLAATVLLFAGLYMATPVEQIHALPLLEKLFDAEHLRFWWLAGPIVGVVLFAKKI